MSDPFASLMLNGIKQIESRNSDVISAAGTDVCLVHIGRKLWPGEDYMEELWRQGIPSSDWDRLTCPPRGFARGDIAGVVELSSTRRATEADFCSDEVRRKVLARRENMGKYLTDIRSAQWLKRPVKASGRPGVWWTHVWLDALPSSLAERLVESCDNDQGPKWTPPRPGAEGAPLPALVVFDLDGCCWHPEMFQTLGDPPYRPLGGAGNRVLNSAGEEIRLLPSAQVVWRDLHESDDWRVRGTKVAVASSTYANKALPLLREFRLGRGGRSMADVADPDLIEIYYRRGEGKRPHFMELQRKTGVKFEEMLFFDDSKDNIDSVARLGVACQHTPDGLTAAAWEAGLQTFGARRATARARRR